MWGRRSVTWGRLRRRVVFLTLALVAAASQSASSEAGSGPRDRILLQGGKVIVHLVPTAPSDCPVNWVCLWEHQNYTGQMVQYRDCCPWYNLGDVGFNNTMSSWRNRKTVDAKVADNTDGGGERLCLNDGAQSASVGSWDNRATSIKIFSSSGAC